MGMSTRAMSPFVVNIRTRGRLLVPERSVGQRLRRPLVSSKPCARGCFLSRDQTTGSAGNRNQVTATIFEEQTDGLLSATEESNKLSEGGRRTPPQRLARALWPGLHAGMTRREASSGAGPEIVYGHLLDAGGRRLSGPRIGGWM
jgi:hypothetical protein